MMKFKLPFVVKTSHNIENFEFQGSNNIEIEVDDSEFVINLNNQNINVKLFLDNNYFEVESEENDIEDLASKLEFIFSYKIDEDNLNRHYGCHFIEIDRFKISIINSSNSIGLRDSVSIVSTKSKKVSFKSNFEYDEFILSTYYEALKAPSSKLKFFNLALILEYIESSSVYKEMFLNEDDFLFNKGIFNKFKNDFTNQQFNRLCGLSNNKTFTKKSRKEKLYELLKEYDVLNTKYFEEKELNIDSIGEILQLRNKIFHSSNTKFENVLWKELFPLVENIVSKGRIFE